HRCIDYDLAHKNWSALTMRLLNTTYVLDDQKRLAAEDRTLRLSLALAIARDIAVDILRCQIDMLGLATTLHDWTAAERAWEQIETLGRDWDRELYPPGRAEIAYVAYRLEHGDLAEAHLVAAERLSEAGRSRLVIRNCHTLRAEWYMESKQWTRAIE